MNQIFNTLKKVNLILGLGFLLQSGLIAQDCGTQFTDSGGAANPYSANENTSTTICPDVMGSMVTVTFSSFDVEQSVFTGNCFDALSVYDGSDATATLIDAFCGNDDAIIPAPITATNSSGCLTFVFTSNGSNEKEGWVAEITCSTPPTTDCNASAGTFQIN